MVYDPTMDMQKSLKPPFAAGNDSESALETSLLHLFICCVLDGNFVLSPCLTWVQAEEMPCQERTIIFALLGTWETFQCIFVLWVCT